MFWHVDIISKPDRIICQIDRVHPKHGTFQDFCMTAGTNMEVLWNGEPKLCRSNDRLLVFNCFFFYCFF